MSMQFSENFTVRGSWLAHGASRLTLAGLAFVAFGCDSEGEPAGIDAAAALVDERDGPAEVTPGGRAARASRFCVVEAHEGEPTDLAAAVEPEVTCFPRYSEAIFFAVGEQLPEDASPETHGPKTLRAAVDPAAAETHIIAYEYEHKSFGGDHIIITAPSPCSTKSKWINLSSGWQERIDSAQAFAGCNNSYHYEHVNLGGSTRNCGQACWYVGDAMHDRTSSIHWTK